jgi:uncharacterized protein (TIGR02118 family)
MIKAVTYFTRRSDLSVEDFVRYWQNDHAAKVCRLPGLRRYVQNPAHPSGYSRGRQPDFDGIAEVWFDDVEAMRANAAGPEYAAVREDEPNFIDVTSMGSLLCDEHVIVDGPTAPFKYIAAINRREDVDVDRFQTYWRTVHGPLAARNPYIRRYVQNHVRRGFYDSGRVPPFDGLPMTWFDSFEDLRASAATAELAATRADEANFMADAGGHLPFVLATEHVVVP